MTRSSTNGPAETSSRGAKAMTCCDSPVISALAFSAAGPVPLAAVSVVQKPAGSSEPYTWAGTTTMDSTLRRNALLRFAPWTILTVLASTIWMSAAAPAAPAFTVYALPPCV